MLRPGDIIRFPHYGVYREGRVTRVGNGIVFVKLPNGHRRWIAASTAEPTTKPSEKHP